MVTPLSRKGANPFAVLKRYYLSSYNVIKVRPQRGQPFRGIETTQHGHESYVLSE